MVPKAVIAGEAQLRELQEAAAKEAASDGADAGDGATQTVRVLCAERLVVMRPPLPFLSTA